MKISRRQSCRKTHHTVFVVNEVTEVYRPLAHEVKMVDLEDNFKALAFNRANNE